MVLFFSPHFIVAVALLSAVIYIKPSVLNPTVWTTPSPLRSLTGTLAPNNVLEQAIALHEGQVMAPESFAFHPVSGDVYASLGDGRIVVLSSAGALLKTVVFVGGLVGEHKDLKAHGLHRESEMNYCTTEYIAKRLPWNTQDETNCGRPLGLRIKTVRT
jgi:hypothetical protein